MERFEYAEPHMGVVFSIILYHETEALADQAAEAAFKRIAKLNKILSDYDPESELSHFASAPAGSEIPLSDDLFKVLWISKELAKQTDGIFDPTLGPLTQLWRTSRKIRQLPSQEDLTDAKSRSGYQKLILNKRKKSGKLKQSGMRLDLGGIGKGYASDCALEILHEYGVHSALVAASGDIAVSNPPPGREGWRIQIETLTESNEDPDAGTYIISLKNAAVSTSGDVNQFIWIEGKRYSHIVDPKTGLGLTQRIGATVMHKQATYSDALGTVLCLMGEKKGMSFLKKHSGAVGRIGYLDSSGEKHYVATPLFPKPLDD
ncbi:MAG: FAD:protein FMN transferase [Limisphaerales bacterium]